MFGNDFGLISAVYAVLFVFGFLYNALVAWLERRGYDEGYTAILVVGSTLITLVGVAVVDWQAAVLTLGTFACSAAIPATYNFWWWPLAVELTNNPAWGSIPCYAMQHGHKMSWPNRLQVINSMSKGHYPISHPGWVAGVGLQLHLEAREVTARTVKFLGRRDNGSTPISEPPPDGGEDEGMLPF